MNILYNIYHYQAASCYDDGHFLQQKLQQFLTFPCCFVSGLLAGLKWVELSWKDQLVTIRMQQYLNFMTGGRSFVCVASRLVFE